MLRPFVPRTTCDKCGSSDIGASYHKNQSECRIYSDQHVENEHIHRTCHTCGYNWPEATVDRGRYDSDIKL